jgi:hypothetical protein
VQWVVTVALSILSERRREQAAHGIDDRRLFERSVSHAGATRQPHDGSGTATRHGAFCRRLFDCACIAQCKTAFAAVLANSHFRAQLHAEIASNINAKRDLGVTVQLPRGLEVRLLISFLFICKNKNEHQSL